VSTDPIDQTKVCGTCSVPKPLDGFSPMARGRYGRAAHCKMCLAECRRVRRRQNPQLDRANERRWYAKNTGKKSAAGRARYWARPEQFRSARRAYGQLATVKQQNAMREALRRAKRRSVPALPFTAVQLAERMSMWAGCWMCGGPWDQVDHVKPINRGGPHFLSNLRPACKSCNSSKQDRWLGSAWAHGLAVSPC
jgi:5-methylcytosine-specific restriction endonuclease McrA